ncbi:putative porin [Microbulbifer magnicolonia]|uniref:putative porin n=1 Tax=Microbulbifer magnicolonia TaxID=3109744 RepID=UPI002B417D55|nr:putative porin [Microbulbifer sp. GG15]
MKFKLAALPLMLLSATVAAEQYTSITEADYIQTDTGFADIDQLLIGSTYYFAPKETLGPLKEFEYINKVTNIFGGYSYADSDFGDADSLAVGGEYFAANGFVVGGAMLESDGGDMLSASLGYLFTPNFLMSLEAVDVEDADSELFVNARYNHQLNGTDYIGFDVSVDDDLDSKTVSSKYFTEFAGGRYLAAEVSVNDTDDTDLFWAGNVEFYFNQNTSVGFGYDDADSYELNATHFFNRNVAAKVAYGSNTEFDEVDVFSLGLTVQL